VASLLGLQAQHFVGGGASGDGQIEEAGDGRTVVRDEQQDERRDENTDQGPNLCDFERGPKCGGAQTFRDCRPSKAP
jgi:hypothetical protein